MKTYEENNRVVDQLTKIHAVNPIGFEKEGEAIRLSYVSLTKEVVLSYSYNWCESKLTEELKQILSSKTIEFRKKEDSEDYSKWKNQIKLAVELAEAMEGAE